MSLWQSDTPIERQAAAAELWMRLTGRDKIAQAELFDEAMEKMAGKMAAVTAPGTASDDSRPKLRNYAVPGAVVGGIGGALLGRKRVGRTLSNIFKGSNPAGRKLLMAEGFKQPASKAEAIRHSTIGGGVAGTAVGGLAGLSTGIVCQVNHSQKNAALHPAAIGAIGGGLTLAPVGALTGYLSHRKGPNGKSKSEIYEEMELEKMRRLLEVRGKSPDSLSGLEKMRHRYANLRHQSAVRAKESPGIAAAKQSVPWALAGAATGAATAPRIARLVEKYHSIFGV